MNKRARLVISAHLKSMAQMVEQLDARHFHLVHHGLALAVRAVEEEMGIQARRSLAAMQKEDQQ